METRTSGSEGGPRKRTERNLGTAPRSDPYTYMPTFSGPLYLAVVLDAFSRAVVGWSMRTDLSAELVTEALEMAIQRRCPRPGLIHHSDQR